MWRGAKTAASPAPHSTSRGRPARRPPPVWDSTGDDGPHHVKAGGLSNRTPWKEQWTSIQQGRRGTPARLSTEVEALRGDAGAGAGAAVSTGAGGQPGSRVRGRKAVSEGARQQPGEGPLRRLQPQKANPLVATPGG